MVAVDASIVIVVVVVDSHVSSSATLSWLLGNRSDLGSDPCGSAAADVVQLPLLLMLWTYVLLNRRSWKSASHGFCVSKRWVFRDVSAY